jgi:hypothetical protein
MNDREHNIKEAEDGSCQWLFTSGTFRDWLRKPDATPFFVVRGKLGSGKSTLMKQTIKLLKGDAQQLTDHILSFFVDDSARTNTPQATENFFRSLVYQVIRCKSFPKHGLREPLERYKLDKSAGCDSPWLTAHSSSIFADLLNEAQRIRILIFVDAFDVFENPVYLLTFLRKVALEGRMKHSGVKICISTQHSFADKINDYTEVVVHESNGPDIAAYVDENIHVNDPSNRSLYEQLASLKRDLVEKSSGVFLWVVLLTARLQKVTGLEIPKMKCLLDDTPTELSDVYKSMIPVDEVELQAMCEMMDWVLLSARPLTLDEWHHVFAMMIQPPISSLEEWRSSSNYTESSFMLLHSINRTGCGFVNTKRLVTPRVPNDILRDVGSLVWPNYVDLEKTSEHILQRVRNVCGGVQTNQDSTATSLRGGSSGNLDTLDNGAGSAEAIQYVDVIHDSVRSFFFLEGDFAVPRKQGTSDPRGTIHLVIVDTLLRYMLLEDVSAIFRPQSSSKSRSDEETDMSVGSSASSSNVSSVQGLTRRRRRFSSTSSVKHKKWAKLLKESNAPIQHSNETERYIESQQAYSPHGRKYGSDQDDTGTEEKHDYERHDFAVYPHLRQYSHDMLTFHAKAADDTGTRPDVVLDYLLAHDWRLWATSRYEMQQDASLLYFAARWDLVTWMECLVDRRKKHVDSKGGKLCYPLTVAAYHGNVRAVDFLLVHGAKLWRVDSRGRTALHYIAVKGHEDLMNTISNLTEKNSLVRRNVQEALDIQDNENHTAAYLASYNEFKNITSALGRLGPSLTQAEITFADERAKNDRLRRLRQLDAMRRSTILRDVESAQQNTK